MNEQTITALHELATKLGTTADHLWVILVAAQAMHAKVAITTAITGIVLAILWGYFANALLTKNDDEDSTVVAGALLWIACATCIIVSTSNAYNAAYYIASPEYCALLELSNLLHR